ncbi:HYR domain-containing protein [Aestuariivivens insulae]|uniref:HYR domain-containing protein n=1 Tax=Aestuariivivens insulae TaxID=1621988 RepID=UPI001F573391|nr:HYR domain-containing protein [Aestuariivivens insulae]
MKKITIHLHHVIMLMALLLGAIGHAQTTVTKYFTGPTQEIDGCGGAYCADVGSVNFSASDFPTGAVITDVNVTITWQKTGGTCSSPTSDNPNNVEISFRMDAVDISQDLVLAPQVTWSGETQGGVVTTVFDDSAATVPSGTPTSGTFKPAGLITLANSFNGETPVGTWQLKAGDTASNNNALCVYNFSVSITANVPPTAVCSNYTAYLDIAGETTITPQDVDGGSSDTEGPVSLSLDTDTFDCSNLGDNTVTLTVTDFAGATDTCTATVTVVDNMPPEVICPNDTTVNVDPGSCTYTASASDFVPGWVDNCNTITLTNNINGQSNLNNVAFNKGDTVVTWTAKDASGNSDSCSVTVTVVANALEITNAYPSNICFGGAANSGSIYLEWNGDAETITVTSGGSSNSYNSNLGDGNLTIGSLTAGTYHIEIQDFCGQTVSTDVEVLQLDELAITTAFPNNICFGGAANSGSIDLAWNGEAENIAVSFTGGNWTYGTGLENGQLKIEPLTAGTYHIEILDVCGKTVSTDVEVLQLDELAITTAFPNNICFGGAANSGSIDLAWNGEAENIAVSFTGGNWTYGTGLESRQLKIEPLTAGTYHIEILDVCGKTVFTDVEVVQLDELAIASVSPNNICYGGAANSGSIDLEWLGEAENISVSFSSGNWTYGTGLESGQLKIEPLTVGTYHIEILDVCGQTVSTDVDVVQLDELAITTALPSNICFGGAADSGSIYLEWNGEAQTVTVTSSGYSNSYNSNLGDGNLTIGSLTARTYHIEILDVCGQTVSTDVEVAQIDELAITSATPNNICFGAAANSGSIDLEWNGEAENISVSFTGGNWTYGTGLESGQLNIMPLNAGSYHIEILDVCGKSVTTDVEVLQMGSTLICPTNAMRGHDTNSCDYQVQGTEFDPTFGNNCGIASIINDFNNSSSLNGAVVSNGTTINWTISYNDGNSENCSFTITVEDNEPPIAVCKDATIYLDQRYGNRYQR